MTEEESLLARPLVELLPDLASKMRRTRGKQKTATKVSTTIRLDEDVLAKFRATGPGWQSRMNDMLRKAAGL